MNRWLANIALVLLMGISAAAAQGQVFAPGAVGIGPYGGFGPYAGFSPYGVGPYASFSPYGGYWGYGGLGGYGFGPLDYSQQLFLQQASLTQQIYQQRQQAIIGQINQAQSRLASLDATKQQMFAKYLELGNSDKAAVRAKFMSDYLALDAQGKEGWKRDGVVQAILGPDLPRLDNVARIESMSEGEKSQLRTDLLNRYRSLTPAEQKAWQNDALLKIIMGPDWWPR